MTKGRLEGAELNSMDIEFVPQDFPRFGGSYKADTRTAGAVTLLLQVSLPCLLFSGGKSHLELRGGTNADMAPQIDFLLEIFRPNLAKFGAQFKCDILRRGYFPRGGGQVTVCVEEPVEKCLKPVEMIERGDIVSIRIVGHVAGNLPIALAEEMAQAAENEIRKKLKNVNITLEVYKAEHATGNGSGIFICAKTSQGCVLGGSSNGSPKKKPFKTGIEAANDLLEPLLSGACVDHWMQDQLIMYMALAEGKSRIKASKPLTLHTKTAIYICEKFCAAKFNIIEDGDENCVIIECDGFAFSV